MTKFFPSEATQNISTYSLAGDLQNYSFIFPSAAPAQSENEIDPIQTIQRNLQIRSNPAYVLGAILRNIWDNLPIFSLPMTEAVEVRGKTLQESHENLIQELQRDDELEEALSRGKLELHQEQIPDLEKDEEIMKNLANELRLAASQGDRTRSLILRTLTDLDLKIFIFDPVRSRKKIDEYVSMADDPSAVYNTERKEISIFTFWDGKFSSGTLIHEFGHADEFQRNLEYDKELIGQCFDSLRSWEDQLFDHFYKLERGKKEQVKQVEQIVQHYRGSYCEDSYSTFFIKFGNYYDKESGILNLNFGGNRGVNILSKVILDEHGERAKVIYDPFAVVNTRNGKEREISDSEKQAYQAYFMSHKAAFHNQVLSKRYEEMEGEEREIQVKEMHAYLRALVPEPVLNIFCPKGFLKKPSPEPTMKPDEQETETLVKQQDNPERDL